MSLDLETNAAEAAPVQGELLDAESSPLTLSLQDFVGEFGDELLDALNSANPPVYTGPKKPVDPSPQPEPEPRPRKQLPMVPDLIQAAAGHFHKHHS